MLKRLILSLAFTASAALAQTDEFTPPPPAPTKPNVQQVISYSYASGTVTTSAYTQMVASTIIASDRLLVCDTSGKLIKIAIGAIGSELDLFTATPNACIIIPHLLAAGSRLSLKAIDAAASNGFATISLLQ